jgi:hypothetical protein
MENNKRFDVHEFTYREFKDGLNPIPGDLEKIGTERPCIFGHKVYFNFVGDYTSGNYLIRKIMYIREFDCHECKKVIYAVCEIWDKWIPDSAYPMSINGPDGKVKYSTSFQLRD